MAGAYPAFHSCSASSCCPQYHRGALVCAFCGVLVTPGLTWRRVPAPLLSLRRDVTSGCNPLSSSATTTQTANAYKFLAQVQAGCAIRAVKTKNPHLSTQAIQKKFLVFSSLSLACLYFKPHKHSGSQVFTFLHHAKC